MIHMCTLSLIKRFDALSELTKSVAIKDVGHSDLKGKFIDMEAALLM